MRGTVQNSTATQTKISYCFVMNLMAIFFLAFSLNIFLNIFLSPRARANEAFETPSPVCKLNNKTHYTFGFKREPMVDFQDNLNIQNDLTFQNNLNTSKNLFANDKNSDRETLRVLVWNVLKYKRDGVYDDLTELKNRSDLVLLQEASHRSDIEKYFESFFPNWMQTFFMSFCESDTEAFGVQNGSNFPILKNQSWPAPDSEPFSTIHKMSGYSEILINGHSVHVVNTHGLNFNAGGPFQRQMDDVAKRLKKVSGPIIWAGDFNTWSSSRMSYLLDVTKKLGLSHVQFKNDPRGQVLDHVFYRGLELRQSEIIEVSTSDHYPLLVEFSISQKQKSDTSTKQFLNQKSQNPLNVQ